MNPEAADTSYYHCTEVQRIEKIINCPVADAFEMVLKFSVSPMTE